MTISDDIFLSEVIHEPRESRILTGPERDYLLERGLIYFSPDEELYHPLPFVTVSVDVLADLAKEETKGRVD